MKALIEQHGGMMFMTVATGVIFLIFVCLLAIWPCE
jgi:hypothetical protein